MSSPLDTTFAASSVGSPTSPLSPTALIPLMNNMASALRQKVEAAHKPEDLPEGTDNSGYSEEATRDIKDEVERPNNIRQTDIDLRTSTGPLPIAFTLEPPLSVWQSPHLPTPGPARTTPAGSSIPNSTSFIEYSTFDVTVIYELTYAEELCS